MPIGSCVCGAVQFDVQPPYRFFQYCHCSRCRKRSGSAHAANVAVMADQLSFTKGSEHVRTFELSTAKSWSNAFCDVCGSGLPWRTRDGRAWVVPVGGLDEDPGARPTRSIHYASRAVWHVDAATLPAFDDEAARK